jgi:hypothetical protein
MEQGLKVMEYPVAGKMLGSREFAEFASKFHDWLPSAGKNLLNPFHDDACLASEFQQFVLEWHKFPARQRNAVVWFNDDCGCPKFVTLRSLGGSKWKDKIEAVLRIEC